MNYSRLLCVMLYLLERWMVFFVTFVVYILCMVFVCFLYLCICGALSLELVFPISRPARGPWDATWMKLSLSVLSWCVVVLFLMCTDCRCRLDPVCVGAVDRGRLVVVRSTGTSDRTSPTLGKLDTITSPFPVLILISLNPFTAHCCNMTAPSSLPVCWEALSASVL